MGFGLFWNIQFHFSWVLLPPFIALALAWRLWRGAIRSFGEMAGLILGSLISGAFLLPTLIVFGLHQASSGLGLAVHFNWNNFEAIYLVLPRFLSLVCYELPRFLGPGANDRWDAVTHFPVMFLPAVFLWIVGILQAIVLFFMIFMKDTKHKDWKAVHVIIGISFVLVLSLIHISQARRKAVKIVRKIKTKPSSTPVSFNSILVFILFGFFFGYFLSKSRATDYDSIQDMFRLCLLYTSNQPLTDPGYLFSAITNWN